jgi:hypothetical protein
MVLRQSSTMFAPVALWLFCAVAVADAVIEGTAGFTVRVVALMSLLAYAAWMLLASPCLVVETDGLRIVNPLRVHWIPFGALDEVRVRGLTTFVAHEEAGGLRSVTSWNAPGQPRKYAAETPPVAGIIERARAAWESRSRGVTTTAVMVTSWRVRAALVLAALVTVNVAIWFR